MSVRSVIGGTVRTLVIAAATAGAALGALVVFEPFGRAPQPAPAQTATAPASLALQERIEALRLALRETEQQIEAVAAPAADTATRAQYEVQLAAAIERRDLALRHADAIRKSLEAGVTPSSLAAIRDSVVIGQMLTQQVALDAQIAVESARLRANHPTMRALAAQRTALATQIRQEASSIAAALEAEARIDDAQIALLQSQLAALPMTSAPDTAGLEAQAATQRAELDGLVDAYFNIPASSATVPSALQSRDLLTPANMLVIAVAALAALVFQLLLAIRRRRAKSRSELVQWRVDRDPEAPTVVAELQQKAA